MGELLYGIYQNSIWGFTGGNLRRENTCSYELGFGFLGSILVVYTHDLDRESSADHTLSLATDVISAGEGEVFCFHFFVFFIFFISWCVWFRWIYETALKSTLGCRARPRDQTR